MLLATRTIQRTIMTSAAASMMKGKTPSAEDKQVILDILSNYQCHPSEQSYSHYHRDAVFADPVSIAKGLDCIKSQFNGMPKIFSRSDTQELEILETGSTKIKMDLTQNYIFKKPEGKSKVVRSIVTLDRDSHGLITRHEEEWDGKPNKYSEDGFVGWLQQMRKEFSAGLVHKTVTSDPSKV